jgi:hypothetical protein
MASFAPFVPNTFIVGRYMPLRGVDVLAVDAQGVWGVAWISSLATADDWSVWASADGRLIPSQIVGWLPLPVTGPVVTP